MSEIKEVLRVWLAGAGLRTAAVWAGVDRKTARRYVEAGKAAGLFLLEAYDEPGPINVGTAR